MGHPVDIFLRIRDLDDNSVPAIPEMILKLQVAASRHNPDRFQKRGFSAVVLSNQNRQRRKTDLEIQKRFESTYVYFIDHLVSLGPGCRFALGAICCRNSRQR